MRPALVVGLCAMGGLLLTYRGRTAGQQLLSVAAGACLAIMAVCPTGRSDLGITPSNVVHVAAAASFSMIAIAMVGGLGSTSDSPSPLRYRAARGVRTAACIVMSLCLAVAAADLLLGLRTEHVGKERLLEHVDAGALCGEFVGDEAPACPDPVRADGDVPAGTLLALAIGNQPVNLEAAAWSPATLPPNWSTYRDQW